MKNLPKFLWGILLIVASVNIICELINGTVSLLYFQLITFVTSIYVLARGFEYAIAALSTYMDSREE